MPQRSTTFFKNGIYHIFNRGHNKQSIFLSPKDFQRYINRLKQYLDKHPVTLLAYCLMPNHIHLLIEQNTEESIEKFMHRLHTAYTMYFNKRYERTGSVFQGRFKAKLIDSDEYLIHVSRYIHQNPIEILRAQGPALSLEKYCWSSYHEYLSPSQTSIAKRTRILDYFAQKTTNVRDKIQKYREFVEEGLNALTQDKIEDINNGIV